MDADLDSALLLDWLLNVPMPRQAPQGLRGMAALQRRIALSVWHSLLGDSTLSLSPASSSCCSGGFQTRNEPSDALSMNPNLWLDWSIQARLSCTWVS